MTAGAPEWLSRFPDLAREAEAPLLALLDKARIASPPAGSVLFRDGDSCAGYVLVLEGAARVQKTDPEGREIVLYRIEEGQSCMLTTACLLGGTRYPAEGIAETDMRMVLLPAATFEAAMDGSRAFRRFVMRGIGKRIADLMLLIEDVAFGQMDRRLARRLLALDPGDGVLRLTHQQLATELGTAREVVSRLLKDFERRGWLQLGRGWLRLLDRPSLARRAGE